MSSVTLETTTNTIHQQHQQQYHQQELHKQEEKGQPSLRMHQYHINHQDHEVISSGYSSQEGADASLVNYLSTLKPVSVDSNQQQQNQQQQNQQQQNQQQQNQQQQNHHQHNHHQHSQSNSSVISALEEKNGTPKISSSQLNQVIEYEGTTVSTILNYPRIPSTAVSPSPVIGDIRSSSSAMSPRNRCLSPQCACCQRSEVLLRINEELLEQKHQLEDRNESLSEEIQVSRRFYQGTLADLTAQLSIAESRIKYLREVVSTHEEALVLLNKQISLTPPNPLGKTEHFAQPPSLSATTNGHTQTNNCHPTPSATTTTTSSAHQQQQQQQQRLTKSLPTSPRDVIHHTSSAASSVTSEPPRTRLNMKNIAKFKEKLMERNQLLKTDIELLKFKTEPSSRASTSLSSQGSRRELPAIKSKSRDWVTASGSQSSLDFLSNEEIELPSQQQQHQQQTTMQEQKTKKSSNKSSRPKI